MTFKPLGGSPSCAHISVAERSMYAVLVIAWVIVDIKMLEPSSDVVMM